MWNCFETIRAQASAGLTYTETVTIQVPGSPSDNVLISCALQQVNQQGPNGQAQIAITAYVQKGETHNGSWAIVTGTEITSVTSVLTVASAQAAATVLFIGY